MSKSFIPQGYRSKLGLYDTQNAIEIIKSTFLESLSAVLRLKRVSAPLFVNPAEDYMIISTVWSAPFRSIFPRPEGTARWCSLSQNGSVMRSDATASAPAKAS